MAFSIYSEFFSPLCIFLYFNCSSEKLKSSQHRLFTSVFLGQIYLTYHKMLRRKNKNKSIIWLHWKESLLEKQPVLKQHFANCVFKCEDHKAGLLTCYHCRFLGYILNEKKTELCEYRPKNLYQKSASLGNLPHSKSRVNAFKGFTFFLIPGLIRKSTTCHLGRRKEMLITYPIL